MQYDILNCKIYTLKRVDFCNMKSIYDFYLYKLKTHVLFSIRSPRWVHSMTETVRSELGSVVSTATRVFTNIDCIKLYLTQPPNNSCAEPHVRWGFHRGSNADLYEMGVAHHSF